MRIYVSYIPFLSGRIKSLRQENYNRTLELQTRTGAKRSPFARDLLEENLARYRGGFGDGYYFHTHIFSLKRRELTQWARIPDAVLSYLTLASHGRKRIFNLEDCNQELNPNQGIMDHAESQERLRMIVNAEYPRKRTLGIKDRS